MAVLPHQSMSMLKVKSDHRSKFSNLSNWKEEAWKTSVVDESEEWSSQEIFQFKQLEGRRLKIWGLQRDSNPWPPRYRCDARPTERRSHTLGGQFVRWLHISVDYASHRYREGHGFESRWSPDIFRLLPSNFLNWKIYCDDHSSLSSTTAVQIWLSYVFHNDYALGKTTVLRTSSFWLWIGHFRVHFSLYFKTSQSLLWMSVFIHIVSRTNYRNNNFALTRFEKETEGNLERVYWKCFCICQGWLPQIFHCLGYCGISWKRNQVCSMEDSTEQSWFPWWHPRGQTWKWLLSGLYSILCHRAREVKATVV